jgi:relaxasome subunit MobC
MLIPNETGGAMAKLEDLLEKRKKLDALIQQVRAKETAQKRKDENRRKILVGAAILEEVAAGSFPEEDLKKILDARLVRSGDRALFGLPIKTRT